MKIKITLKIAMNMYDLQITELEMLKYEPENIQNCK